MPVGGDNVLRVAIIGSGPAGFYAAEALVKAHEIIEVDIIDRLPTPYGLIRGGVAPDHQSIKGVYRRYEKAALLAQVNFIGNLQIGGQISLDEVRELYDAVVLATGAPNDRKLGIPGEDKIGVYGSAEFVGWYNSHPDFAELNPDLSVASVAVIGNGNVAIDVARVLAKTKAEMASSDLAPYAANVIQSAPIKDIWMFGRRGPIEGAFTQKELGELGELENCTTLALPEQIPDDTGDLPDKEAPGKRKNLAHLRSFSEHHADGRDKTLHLQFFASPVEILGEKRVTGIRLEHTRVEDGKCIGLGTYFDIECGMVIPCIGTRTIPLEGAAFDDWAGRYVNEDGLIEAGLYAVGWAKRGPTGTIGTNRPDSTAVAKRLLEEISAGNKPGGRGLSALADERGLRLTSFKDWKKIELAEENAASDPAPRRKFWSVKDMLTVLD